MIFVFESTKHSEYINFKSCTDINNSGIKRFTTSPLALSIIYEFFSFENKKQQYKNDVQVLTTIPTGEKYIIASGVAHSPKDWCGPDYQNIGFDKNNHDKQSAFAHLSERYLNDLKSGVAFLLLDQSHEGYQVDWLWSWFHNNCDHYRINPKQLIYVTGNLDSSEQYTTWADYHKLENRILVVPYPHFESVMAVTLTNSKLPLPTATDQITYKRNRLAEIKNCNILQKRPRGHRIWFFKYLYEHDLIKNNIISMNDFQGNGRYYDGKHLSEEEYNELNMLTPIIPVENPMNYELGEFSSPDSGEYLTMFNEQTMLDSWLTVISEASFADSENTCFISEKTFKPIACNHPFIILGNKGSLQHLRNMGYKTFSPYIDETYDTLPTWDRMEAIINELIRLSAMTVTEKLEWYENMKEILEHNYNTLIHNSNKLDSSVLMIEQYYNNHV